MTTVGSASSVSVTVRTARFPGKSKYPSRKPAGRPKSRTPAIDSAVSLKVVTTMTVVSSSIVRSILKACINPSAMKSMRGCLRIR